jgi:hypothetical protein
MKENNEASREEPREAGLRVVVSWPSQSWPYRGGAVFTGMRVMQFLRTESRPEFTLGLLYFGV